MIHIDTRGKEVAGFYGRIVCDWEPEAARDFLWMTLYEHLRVRAEAKGEEVSDEQLRPYVESRVEAAMSFIHRRAAPAVALAQEFLVTTALRLVLSSAVGDKITGDERREDFARLWTRFNSEIGIHRGRKAGKKVSKPSKAKALEHREQILTAMREAHKRDPLHNPQHKTVAPLLGITTRTMGAWLKDIQEETGEEWEDLIVEAVQKRKK